ncbi:mucin-binding protein [Ligilactobacillus salivarius]|uniref:mucin-binding protein n=1 Tax=Ligilactobacillus salivarius TaxID=1624 RepID=UPI0009DA0B81|nr:hypothetical protein [Ligilactobacillus salivarius]OQR18998.1 hypothetical protein B6U39_09140 [Ligilactobacillus salivarius]
MSMITIDNLQGFDRSLLEQTFTRTIDFNVPKGYEKPDSIEQSVTFSRLGEINDNTKDFKFGPWKCKDNVLTEIRVPRIKGLKPSAMYVPSKTINNPPKNVNEIEEHNFYVTVNYTVDNTDEISDVAKTNRKISRKSVDKNKYNDYEMLLTALTSTSSKDEKEQLLQGYSNNVDMLEKFLEEDSLSDDDKQIIAKIINGRGKQANDVDKTNDVKTIEQEVSTQADEEVYKAVDETEGNNEEVETKDDDESSSEDGSSENTNDIEEPQDNEKPIVDDGSREEKNNKKENITYDDDIVNEFSKATSKKLKSMISRPELIQPIPLSDEYKYLMQDMDIASVLRQLKIEGKIELIENSWIIDLY